MLNFNSYQFMEYDGSLSQLKTSCSFFLVICNSSKSTYDTRENGELLGNANLGLKVRLNIYSVAENLRKLYRTSTYGLKKNKRVRVKAQQILRRWECSYISVHVLTVSAPLLIFPQKLSKPQSHTIFPITSPLIPSITTLPFLSCFIYKYILSSWNLNL